MIIRSKGMQNSKYSIKYNLVVIMSHEFVKQKFVGSDLEF